MMGAAIESKTVLVPGDLVWREVAGEMVVLDAQGKTVFGLNRVGGAVWKRLDGVRALGDIAGEIAGEFRVDAERALGDVLAFAEVLVTRKLVRCA